MKSFFAPYGAQSPRSEGLGHPLFTPRTEGLLGWLAATALALVILPSSARALGGIDSEGPCVCDEEFYESQGLCETAYTDTMRACVDRYGRGLKVCLLHPAHRITECITDVRFERRVCERRAATNRLECLGEVYTDYEKCLGSGVCK